MQAQTRKQFLETEAGVSAKLELQRMSKSASYNTPVAYDVSVGRELTFIDRHIDYLTKHPYVKPATYLANLRVMTKAAR
jgi:hypothetical protein